MADKASRSSFSLYELQMNCTQPTGENPLNIADRDAFLNLDDDAKKDYLRENHIEYRFENGVHIFELSEEGKRLALERIKEQIRLVEEQNRLVRDAWRPDDYSEANQHPEPLRSVITFRLLVSQYVAIAGPAYELLAEHWKRQKLADLFLPLVETVAMAMVEVGENPTPFFAAVQLCNEQGKVKFAEAWKSDILPTLRTVELKLRTRKVTATGTTTHTEDKQEQGCGTNDGNKLDDLQRAWRLAYLAHQYAEQKKGMRLTDPEGWSYLKENGIGEDGGELSSYEVPSKDTYADYMTKARIKLNEKKYTPRGGRTGRGGCVRKQSEV